MLIVMVEMKMFIKLLSLFMRMIVRIENLKRLRVGEILFCVVRIVLVIVLVVVVRIYVFVKMWGIEMFME